MYLAYIDGSGRPTKRDKDTKNYVLSSLIIHENQWQQIDNAITKIKMKHFPNLKPEDIELHAKDMLNRKGLFKGLNWDEIYAIFNDICNFLSGDEADICIISAVISKQRIYNGKDIEKWAYRLLVERINKFLEKENYELLMTGMSPQFGIMIIDSNGLKPDAVLRKKITTMLKSGTYYSNLKYLIEDPLFTDSKWRNLIQLVDCIAYAVRKYFRNPSNPSFHDKNWKKYFKQIYNKFDKNEEGIIEGCGIKIFP